MTHWITSWFYEEIPSEGGVYAQVRGDSSSESFKDVYRRCIAVFFATARKCNPDANLALFLNKPWNREASTVADNVASILDELGVLTHVIEYTSAPPRTWTLAWRNQFFVLDVLTSLAAMMAPTDQMLLLDSDIVWSGSPTTQDMWSDLAGHGILTYGIDYSCEQVVNGLSRDDLGDLAHQLGIKEFAEPIEYAGGEFVAFDGILTRAVSEEARRLWCEVRRLHEVNQTLVLEEAHLLSLTYASIGSPQSSAVPFVKRLWTQPFKTKNTSKNDVALPLWHLPAEKKYGIARIYRRLSRDGVATFLDWDPETSLTWMASQTGLPANTAAKILRDTSAAIRGRIGERLRREA